MDLPDLLETRRLTLRPIRPSDAGPMTLFAGDARVANMLTRVPHPYPPGAAETYIETVLNRRTDERLWVLDATKTDGPEFIGVFSVRPREEIAEFGYWVGPPFWNTGYATEAAMAVAAAARAGGAVGLRAEVVEGNEASAHVLSHAGLIEVEGGETFSVAQNRMLPARRFEVVFAASGR